MGLEANTDACKNCPQSMLLVSLGTGKNWGTQMSTTNFTPSTTFPWPSHTGAYLHTCSRRYRDTQKACCCRRSVWKAIILMLHQQSSTSRNTEASASVWAIAGSMQRRLVTPSHFLGSTSSLMYWLQPSAFSPWTWPAAIIELLRTPMISTKLHERHYFAKLQANKQGSSDSPCFKPMESGCGSRLSMKGYILPCSRPETGNL